MYNMNLTLQMYMRCTTRIDRLLNMAHEGWMDDECLPSSDLLCRVQFLHFGVTLAEVSKATVEADMCLMFVSGII